MHKKQKQIHFVLGNFIMFYIDVHEEGDITFQSNAFYLVNCAEFTKQVQ